MHTCAQQSGTRRPWPRRVLRNHAPVVLERIGPWQRVLHARNERFAPQVVDPRRAELRWSAAFPKAAFTTLLLNTPRIQELDEEQALASWKHLWPSAFTAVMRFEGLSSTIWDMRSITALVVCVPPIPAKKSASLAWHPFGPVNADATHSSIHSHTSSYAYFCMHSCTRVAAPGARRQTASTLTDRRGATAHPAMHLHA
jgi:hypothetical protein